MYPIWTCDGAGNILHANADARRFTGHAPDETVRRALPDLFCEADRNQIRATLGRLAEKGSVTGRWRPSRRDGHLRDFVLHRLPDGHIVVVASSEALNERHFESLSMIAPVGIFRTDAGGSCNYINDFWCRTVGMPPEEALGDGWIKALHPDDRQRVMAEWERCIAGNGAFECEYRILRPDGKIIWLYGQTTSISDAVGTVTGHVGAVTDITPIKQAQEALAEARRQIGAMAQKCVERQEKERANLSRELHDEVGQVMTALKLTLTQASRKSLADPASAVEAINHSMKIADEVIGSVRNIARRLRPPQLDDLGLMASLRWHVGRIAAQPAPTILFHENIGNVRFEPCLELACFRVAQEAITNALRHAHASFICVVLVRLHGQLELSILDDGDGFSETEAEIAGPHSLGLLGMRERVTGIGGTFQINSQRNVGTEILARFILPPAS